MKAKQPLGKPLPKDWVAPEPGRKVKGPEQLLREGLLTSPGARQRALDQIAEQYAYSEGRKDD